MTESNVEAPGETRRRGWGIPAAGLLSSLLLLPLAAPANAQDAEPLEELGQKEEAVPLQVRLGLRLGAFEMINSGDSYDAVFGDPLPLAGADLELRFASRWLARISAEYGEIDGEQVLLTDPPRPTGIETTLTYAPIHVSAGFLVGPDTPWRFVVGGGATLLRWEESGPSGSDSSTDPGGHLLLSLERTGDRWGIGGEAIYSSIPDAAGAGGASDFFEEDDLGGLALSVTLRWRIR
ncbi:MAG: hypothetical protein R3234_00960 [Thermoanaerobaculia bacterium]|nr:hypothetical protein [Thermoanaerobaculia bacterium]